MINLASVSTADHEDFDAAGIAVFAFEMGILPSGVDHEAITTDQIAALPDTLRKTVQHAVSEYEAQATIEARCARDADKLECLIQAIEYRAAGYATVQGWIDTSRAILTTDAAQRIADAAIITSPLAWRDR